MNEELQTIRERILETATRLFVERGYHGLSMREIAEACSLSKAGIYYHFEDKEQLFLVILEKSLDELEVITRQAADLPGSTRARIAFFMQALFTRLPSYQRSVIRLANQDINQLAPEKRAQFALRYEEKFIRVLVSILQAGAARGELKPIAPEWAVWALLGLAYPFFSPGSTRSGQADAQVAEMIVSVFMDGMAVGNGAAFVD